MIYNVLYKFDLIFSLFLLDLFPAVVVCLLLIILYYILYYIILLFFIVLLIPAAFTLFQRGFLIMELFCKHFKLASVIASIFM
jgi:hypothetical protein